jgi:hypothetical protein
VKFLPEHYHKKTTFWALIARILTNYENFLIAPHGTLPSHKPNDAIHKNGYLVKETS